MKKSNKVLFITLGSLLAIIVALVLYFGLKAKGMVDEQAGRTAQYYTTQYYEAGCDIPQDVPA